MILRSVGICLGLVALCLLAVGCGGEEGVGENAIVSVYAAAPLCAGAKREAARNDGRVGGVTVRVICLDRAETDGGLNLATIGSNARRATEDSTTIGYIGEPTRAATRFSQSILEAAEIPQISDLSGRVAMAKLLAALRGAADARNLRQAVGDELAG